MKGGVEVVGGRGAKGKIKGTEWSRGSIAESILPDEGYKGLGWRKRGAK